MLKSRFISEQDAYEVKQLVDEVVDRWYRKNRELTPKNQLYQKVYGTLYHRFRITSYKNLSSDELDQALIWLANWRDSF